jgi:hypothetical protein
MGSGRRSSSDRRYLERRISRDSIERRQQVLAMAVERRSGLDRRMELDRRAGLDRRSLSDRRQSVRPPPRERAQL